MAITTIYKWNKYSYNSSTIYTYSSPSWGSAIQSDERDVREACTGYSGDTELFFSSTQGFYTNHYSSDLTVYDAVYGGAQDEASEYTISYSSGKWRVYTRYGTCSKTSETEYSRGGFIEAVTSPSRSSYPDSGYSGGYWYEYVGSQASSDISFSVTPTHLTSTANGKITIVGSAGSGSYQYRLGSGGTWVSVGAFTGLTAGTYLLYGRDAQTIDDVLSYSVTLYNDTAYSAVSEKASTASAADGIITVTASGGSGSYSFSKDAESWQAGNTFTGLTAGSYTISCKDATTNIVKTLSVTVGYEGSSKIAVGGTAIQGIAIAGTPVHCAIGGTVLFL